MTSSDECGLGRRSNIFELVCLIYARVHRKPRSMIYFPTFNVNSTRNFVESRISLYFLDLLLEVLENNDGQGYVYSINCIQSQQKVPVI